MYTGERQAAECLSNFTYISILVKFGRQSKSENTKVLNYVLAINDEFNFLMMIVQVYLSVIIHTLMLKISIILLAILALAAAEKPPVWAVRFSHEFTESYTTTPQRDIGKIWYEADRNRQRIDRNSGKFDPFCSPISTVVTLCIQLVKDSKNWIYFPLLGQCCYCCDQAHGCGILRQDWMRNFDFRGKEDISGQTFNKYVDEENRIDYWTTTDSKQISRRIVEDGTIQKDFLLNTYSQAAIPETIFNLPGYCKESNLCPGLCAKYR